MASFKLLVKNDLLITRCRLSAWDRRGWVELSLPNLMLFDAPCSCLVELWIRFKHALFTLIWLMAPSLRTTETKPIPWRSNTRRFKCVLNCANKPDLCQLVKKQVTYISLWSDPIRRHIVGILQINILGPVDLSVEEGKCELFQPPAMRSDFLFGICNEYIHSIALWFLLFIWIYFQNSIKICIELCHAYVVLTNKWTPYDSNVWIERGTVDFDGNPSHFANRR